MTSVVSVRVFCFVFLQRCGKLNMFGSYCGWCQQVFVKRKVINNGIFCKLIGNTGMQPEIFRGRRGFVELGHLDKHFVKRKRKKCPAGKNFRVFSRKGS